MNQFDDQMNSATWDTHQDLHKLLECLLNQDWKVQECNNLDFAILKNNSRFLEINFTHPPTRENDIVISDHYDPLDHSLLSLAPSVYGHYTVNFEYQNVIPTKKFTCLIGRGCVNRSSWFYWFVRENYLNQAYITYHCEDRSSNVNADEYFDILFKDNQTFKKEHYWVRSNNIVFPFNNFDIPIEQAIIDSEKNLVIETFFEDITGGITLTEKTFRALQLPRPFLLFGLKGSVKLLREWGFDVYDDYIDHSYDAENHWLTRQTMILSELQKPLPYSLQLLEDFEIKARHNSKVLQKNLKQWPEFFKKIQDQLKNLSGKLGDK